MRIQTIDIGDEFIEIIYENGERNELTRCPFPECTRYHIMDLAICPTTGKSITEEVSCQAEEKNRTARAFRAMARYKENHLEGWKNKWRGWLGLWGIFVIGFFSLENNPVDPSKISVNLFTLIFAITWMLFWVIKQSRRNNRMKKQAGAIYSRILADKSIDPQTSE